MATPETSEEQAYYNQVAAALGEAAASLALQEVRDRVRRELPEELRAERQQREQTERIEEGIQQIAESAGEEAAARAREAVFVPERRNRSRRGRTEQREQETSQPQEKRRSLIPSEELEEAVDSYMQETASSASRRKQKTTKNITLRPARGQPVHVHLEAQQTPPSGTYTVTQVVGEPIAVQVAGRQPPPFIVQPVQRSREEEIVQEPESLSREEMERRELLNQEYNAARERVIEQLAQEARDRAAAEALAREEIAERAAERRERAARDNEAAAIRIAAEELNAQNREENSSSDEESSESDVTQGHPPQPPPRAHIPGLPPLAQPSATARFLNEVEHYLRTGEGDVQNLLQLLTSIRGPGPNEPGFRTPPAFVRRPSSAIQGEIRQQPIPSSQPHVALQQFFLSPGSAVPAISQSKPPFEITPTGFTISATSTRLSRNPRLAKFGF